MIGNKPSIYNAQSVYNQGGGSGTFDVDLGGGVSQTLVFPPYLVPVEYIDNSNATTDSKFCMMASEQMLMASQAADLYIKFVIKANKTFLETNRAVAYKYIPQWMYSNNNDIRASVSKNSSNVPQVTLYYGKKNYTFSVPGIDNKLTLITDATVDKFILQEEGGFTQEYTDTRVVPAYNYGQVSVFNSVSSHEKCYKGAFFHGYVRNKTTKQILSLLVPARSKNTDDKKPYIVECVSGSVLINCSEDLNTLGFEFGPDIDLSNEIPGWIT